MQHVIGDCIGFGDAVLQTACGIQREQSLEQIGQHGLCRGVLRKLRVQRIRIADQTVRKGMPCALDDIFILAAAAAEQRGQQQRQKQGSHSAHGITLLFVLFVSFFICYRKSVNSEK